MNNKNPATYEDHAHFRIPADFMPRVHLVARRRGLTAASFMRMAILDALQRSGVSPVGQEQGIRTQ